MPDSTCTCSIYAQHTYALNLDTYWRAILLAVELGFLVFLVYFSYSTSFTV
jgi:hypothetical protein